MAPGSSNNQNNNANHNNNRQTGTKPKSKSSKKNSVPQEMVAPTRRDLQQQLNVLVDWAAVSSASSGVQNNSQPQQQQPQHFNLPSTSGQQQHQQGQNILLKPRNNRTPGEGTCYEIDNLSLQDNSRYIPVRPIVRRNLLNEGGSGEQSEPHNTAVGVVIPTTPNSSLQQTFRLNDGATGAVGGSTHSINNLLHGGGGGGAANHHAFQGYGSSVGLGASAPSAPGTSATGVIPKQNPQHQQQHVLNPLLVLQQQGQVGQPRSTSSPLSYRVPDGASQNQLNLNKNSNHHQQLHQLHAVPSTSSGSRYGGVPNASSVSHSVGPVSGGTVEDTLNQIQEYIKLTTHLISSVQFDNLNGGPRPQSVQSISTNQSTTPVPPSASCDELRYRAEPASKNMQALKEQQAHLLRLQQAARQQLQEMEAMRQMHTASVAPPLESFQTVEQVQDGIGSIMERMRVLSTFIANQQELSNMLGPDNEDVMSDQAMLQQKFQELRDKKSQMHTLVSELQTLNLDANRQFDGVEGSSETRNVPIELTHTPATAADARNATKMFLANAAEGVSKGSGAVSATVANGPQMAVNGTGLTDDDDEGAPLNEEESAVLNGTADMLSEKINEINAMKSQLRRLKDMMDTVKLIEGKTGHESIDEEEEDEEEEEEGDEDEEEAQEAAAAAVSGSSQRRSRSRSVSSAPIAAFANPPPLVGPGESEMSNQEREQLNKRVEALQAMTQDLREQAKSIAAERDRLKSAQTDLQKRRNNVTNLQQQVAGQTSEKLTNHVASFVSLLPAGSAAATPAAPQRHHQSTPGPKERRQMELKAELEQKKRELERIEKMTQNIKKNAAAAAAEVALGSALVTNGDDETPVVVGPSTSGVVAQSKRGGPSSVVSSSVESCSGAGSHHRGTPSAPSIPPPPAPSAISGSMQNNTAGSNATNDSKTNSADSGVTSDMFAHAQLESASYQSSSTRSFPPPMPDICNRNASTDRYRQAKRGADVDGGEVGVLDVGVSGAATSSGGAVRDRTSPWPVFGNGTGAGAGLSSSNTGPHSPHYGHHSYAAMHHDLSHHGVGGGVYGPAYGSSWSTGGGPFGGMSNLLPPHAVTPNTPPDPIVFQHIMQTQQMLMNSITQCNQLLWIQQREIHNLNNAVLLLQERLLGTNNSLLFPEPHGPTVAAAAALIRAESTPPSNGSMHVSNAATTGLYTRARSEQPVMAIHQQQQQQQQSSSPFHHQSHAQSGSLPSTAGMLQQQLQHSMQSYHPGQQQQQQQQPPQQPYSPLAMPQTHAMLSPPHCSVNQQIQRNNTNISQIGLPPSGASSGRFRSGVRPPLNINTLNNALYDEPPIASDGGSMINNLAQQTTATSGPMLPLASSPPSSVRFGSHFNNLNNTSNVQNNLATNANNMQPSPQQQQQQNNLNLYNQQQQHGQDSPSSQAQQTQALNNQVLPGVRANNYWDNFRSYSRQNLLSSNSCKSNEESCAYGGGAAPGAAGTGAAGSGSSSGSGCNTINNQLQRNNSNATNQYMNNQTNKYQTINITRNNSLSNANQTPNAAGMCQEVGAGPSQMMGYQQQQDQSFDGTPELDHSTLQHQQQHHHHSRQHHAGTHMQHPGTQHSYPPQPPQHPHHQQHRQQPMGSSAPVQESPQAASPFQHHPHHPLQPPVQQQPQQQQQHRHHAAATQAGSPAVIDPRAPSEHTQQHASSQHTAPLNQSHSLDLGELQFHTNPINLGLANKTHPKASGHKKYPLSLRSCRDASVGGESSGACYVSGGGDMNLASACTYQHDSKSTSKLFEALKENVYQEVKNLITANESRPHFLIQLFRELQLISSDPLRQRTLQSIQELYNRYIESTLQEEAHVNNVGSNNLLTSSSGGPLGVDVGGRGAATADSGGVPLGESASSPPHDALDVDPSVVVELEVVQNYTNLRQQQQQQHQQQYHFVPSPSDIGSGSRPTVDQSANGCSPPVAGGPIGQEQPLVVAGHAHQQSPPLAVPNSEIINIIMGDIVAVINSVDYINDSVLFKIAGVICNHATSSGGQQQNGGSSAADYGPQQQQHHHHHHHQYHYHHHLPMGTAVPRSAPASSSAATSLLAAASFLSAQADETTGTGPGPTVGRLPPPGDVFNREDFLRHLESWNRTDKDEFISNLENFLNNILLRSSAVENEEEEEDEEDAITGSSAMGSQARRPIGDEVQPEAIGSSTGFEDRYGPEHGHVATGDEATGGGGVHSSFVPPAGGRSSVESAVVVSSSSSANAYASTTYDLAEADQVCDLDSSGSNCVPESVAAAAAAISTTTDHPIGHEMPSSNFVDDRWTVVVQKKSISTSKEDDPSGASGSGTVAGSSESRQRTAPPPPHRAAAGSSSAVVNGGGNNGNNINNNWQSEEVADENLDQSEEQLPPSFY
ncbi:uncharacterized protein LOC128268083 [Anopheles cruzii]|uniref:uncharacterized protein LOC128268083 n=1 Tax=Anopheles cruzii TaxID=68878 RepID=UPI0022EC7A30|nr:uncharacterized protein LOC128268083 [Anopheles cruzii]